MIAVVVLKRREELRERVLRAVRTLQPEKTVVVLVGGASTKGLTDEYVVESDRDFNANVNAALDFIEPWQPKWIYLCPEDEWFEPGAREELEQIFNAPQDVWYVRVLTFWDERHVNVNFPVPRAEAYVWRFRPGLRLHPLVETTCPFALVRSGAVGVMRHRHLDFGYSTEEYRSWAIKEASLRGYLNPVHNVLVQPPRLIPYDKLDPLYPRIVLPHPGVIYPYEPLPSGTVQGGLRRPDRAD